MWFFLVAILDIAIFLFLPWQLGIPYWIHMPCVAVFWIWIPSESKSFRKWWVWSLLFDIEIVSSSKLKSDEQRLYAIFPHGVFSISTIAGFVLNAEMVHVKPVGSSVLFLLPIIKEFVGLAGTVPANAGDIITALQRGKSLAMCPGGLRELPGLDPERRKKDGGFVKRPGFIDIASSLNVKVVPVWAEGEEELYDVWLWCPRIQRILLSWFYYPCFIIAWGLPWLRFWPKSKKLKLHFGEPIPPAKLTQETFYQALHELQN